MVCVGLVSGSGTRAGVCDNDFRGRCPGGGGKCPTFHHTRLCTYTHLLLIVDSDD